MSTQTSVLQDAAAGFDDAADDSIQTEELPPISQDNNIPGTNIPDHGVPDGEGPDPYGYNPNDYAQSDPDIFGIPSGVNPLIDPTMEKTSISGLPNPNPRVPLL